MWNEPARAQALGKEKVALELVVETIVHLEQGSEDVAGLIELAVEAEDQETFDEAESELAELIKKLETLEFRRMFSGPNDANDGYIDIQSGSGGTEAQDWANMLLRMYLRWGEAHGFKTELIECSDGDVAGIKSATIRLVVNMLLAGYALRLGCIVWYENHLLILVAAGILRSPLHLLIQKWMTILKSKSIHLIYALILIEHRAQVDSTLTELILRCV